MRGEGDERQREDPRMETGQCRDSAGPVACTGHLAPAPGTGLQEPPGTAPRHRQDLRPGAHLFIFARSSFMSTQFSL